MKKFAIVYGEAKAPLQKKAIEVLSTLLQDYNIEYPTCFSYDKLPQSSDYRYIYIGTLENNPILKEKFEIKLTHPEEYAIKVIKDAIYIMGYDDIGVVYGCIDFYNKYILKYEFPHDADVYRVNPFENELADFEYSSYPSVKDRGIWTWGHVIYDYRGFFDNMLLCKMNTAIIWNDHAPVNAKEMVDYAHSCGIKLIWGYSWMWGTDCNVFLKDGLNYDPKEYLEKYENEYAATGCDGIYFQSFTELKEDAVGGIVIAEAVTEFVNTTSSLFFKKYPDIQIQFGLHATSVKEKLEYIEKVDKRVTIVWEDAGAFPFSYLPDDLETFEDTKNLSVKIANLRGTDDLFGVVTKGFTKLDWGAFNHLEGPVSIGASSKAVRENRVIRKRKTWKYFQAYWLKNGYKAYDMIKAMQKAKEGNLLITALVEDGMFEENLMFPVALYSEMLWDCNADIKNMTTEVALRDYVTFA